MKISTAFVVLLVMVFMNVAIYIQYMTSLNENSLGKGRTHSERNGDGSEKSKDISEENEREKLLENYWTSQEGKGVMAVQMKIDKRSPVFNREFEFFHIDKKEYRLGDFSEKRTCAGKCAHKDHLMLLRMLLKFDYEFFLILEDDVFFCSDLATIEYLMRYNHFIDILSLGIGGTGLVMRREGIENILAINEPSFRKSGEGKGRKFSSKKLLVHTHFF